MKDSGKEDFEFYEDSQDLSDANDEQDQVINDTSYECKP
jgi:hypothetical protein